jgi:hypothetical protein
MAVLPLMGFVGWNGPARKHDPMCAQQLLYSGILEIMA